MNAKQRFIAAVTGRKTDRPCVHPAIDVVYAAALIGRGVGECFADPTLHAAALARALEIHGGIDGLYVNLCLAPETPPSFKGGEYRVTDEGGMTWRVPKNDVGSVQDCGVKLIGDERVFTANPLKRGIIETYSLLPESLKERYMIVPGLTGPFSQIVFMLGLENVLMLMFDDPGGLKRALEARVKLSLEWADELASLGCECVWIGEGAASSSIISPETYKEFVLPYAARVVARLKAAGILTIMHVCGDINKSAHIIARSGVDAMDIDHMVPLSHARKAVGKICLKGNLNPVDLLRWAPERVTEHCKGLIDEAGRPFVLSTGCLVARDTPRENIDAMAEAAK